MIDSKFRCLTFTSLKMLSKQKQVMITIMRLYERVWQRLEPKLVHDTKIGDKGAKG